MIPQQTFESYPVFGDNATKVKPDDIKYAAGFQQADVLPAEWMNWAWAKNSKGITDANAGLSSVEEEIINVLTSRGKQPSASDNTQLLTVLNMIKAEAALAAHPVGSLYWTSSTEDPATTFGGGTWKQIKDKFILAAGDTYINGNTGGAATVTLTADQIPSHNHSFTPAGSISVTTNPTFTGSEHSHSYTPAGTISVTTNPTFTGSEVTSGANNRGHTHSVGAHAHGLNDHTHSFSGTFTTKNTINTGNTNAKTLTGKMTFAGMGKSDEFDSYYLVSTGSILTATKGTYTDPLGHVPGANSNAGIYSNFLNIDATHRHQVDVSGTTGKASGNTANSTAFDSGGESQNHTHKVTASGTISGGAYKFTGTAATLKATQGGTISGGAYSFTGTAGTTGSKGGGGAHNNMPPYIVKYCWERTA